jgi:predicted metal-dependent hydrolase
MPQALTQLRLPFEVPPAGVKPGRLRQAQLAGGILSYRLVRAKRRTIALFVDAGGIEVRAPHYATIADVEEFVRSKERWIGRRLAEPRSSPFIWQNGAQLPWLGHPITLALREEDHGCRLREGRLEIGLAGSGGWRERALDWIRAQALAFFHGRIQVLSQPHGLRVSSVGLSEAQTRWGSCGAAGRILLSWRLMLLPPHIVDYVVAHELAHLRELNHSPRFWDVVGRLYPGYHSARRELSSLARSLPNL